MTTLQLIVQIDKLYKLAGGSGSGYNLTLEHKLAIIAERLKVADTATGVDDASMRARP